MTFSTLTFFLFAAIVFALYWVLRRPRLQNVALIVASYIFYGWWDARFCLLIAASSLVDYLVGRGLSRTTAPMGRMGLLAVSLVANLGLLGTFKYYDFFITSAVQAAASLGLTLGPQPVVG